MSHEDVVLDLYDMLHEGTEFSSWEVGFIENLKELLDRYEDNLKLSERQYAKAVDILDKHK